MEADNLNISQYTVEYLDINIVLIEGETNGKNGQLLWNNDYRKQNRKH